MRYFWGLDLLRFISALLVVLFHITLFGADRPAWPVELAAAPLGWLRPFGQVGWIGVQIFFVISGFIISASAEHCTAPQFLSKRAVRLFPALWIAALLALAVRLAWGEPAAALLSDFLRTIVLSPWGPYVDGVVWSLVVEVVFYLLVAALIALTPAARSLRSTLIAAALVLGLASTGFALANWLVSNPAISGLGSGPADLFKSFAFDLLLLRHGVFFAIGMLIYLFVVGRGSRSLVLALMVFSAAGCLQIADRLLPGQGATGPVLIWAAATGFIWISAHFGERVSNPRFYKVMRPIGLMTYPLYLNHFSFGQALLPLLAGWISGPVVLFGAVMAVLLVNAWLMANYAEPLVQGKLRKLLARDWNGLSSAPASVRAGR